MTIFSKWMTKFNKYKWEIGLLVISLGFYLFFPFYDGPVWCVDSQSYASMNITREPLYPLFLLFFRSLFGENAYLLPVVLVQSVIAAYATWKAGMIVQTFFQGKRAKGMALLTMGFQFAVTLLCRFAAIRGSSYINSIMTEGLGLSLYVLFVIQLFLYVSNQKTKNLIGTAVYAFLLVSLRKQMMVTLCLMAAVFILHYLIKQRRVKKLLFLLVLTGGILVAAKGADRVYNYAVRGAAIEHAGSSMGMLCTLIYTSKEADASLFQSEEQKQLFLEIRGQAREQGLLIENAQMGWVQLSTHYADSYDAIGYGIINPVIQGYLAEQFDYPEVEAALSFDEYCSDMIKTLLAQEKGGLLSVYLANTWKGFVNSIARMGGILTIFAAGCYLLFGIAYVIGLRLLKKREELKNVIFFAEIVIGGVIINSMVVGAMIFTQPRYMIYSMGLFYGALAALLVSLYAERGKHVV